MKIATIDVGTNSTRLLISEVKDGEVKPLFKRGKVTRLGRGVKERRELSREGIEETLKALREFKEIIREFGVEKVVVATTEAARLAENSEEFLNKVRELGFDIKILSDREEAELVFRANALNFKDFKEIITVDLGGGSTEIVYGKEGRVEYLKSLKFGVVFLAEEFLKSPKPTERELKELEGFIEKELLKVKRELPPLKEPKVIAVGGTITSVVAMEEKMEVYNSEKVHGYTITRQMVKKWYKLLSSMDIEERKKVRGLEEKRADVIVPGLAFFKVFCSVFNIEKLTVSELGLLYGLALKEVLKSG